MGFIGQALERRSWGPTDDRWYTSLLDWVKTAAGISVNEDTALQTAAVYACVRNLSEDVATLPLLTYRRLPRGKERAPELALYDVLHSVANPEMDAITFRQAMQGHLCTWGNAYAEIVRDEYGEVQQLWPLRPDRVTLVRDEETMNLVYLLKVSKRGGFEEVPLAPSQILHLRGFGDGLLGYSPIRLHRETIGLAKATEQFGARFFGNDARPGLVLTYPHKLGDTGQKNLRESFEKRHMGLENSHRVALLEEGVKIEQIGIPPEDAQYLQTRQFQVVEIARIYRMPLHKIDDLTRSTNNNIEHQSLEYVQDTLSPWLVRWEAGVNFRLLDIVQRRQYFVEHLIDGRLRADIKSRYDAYATGRQWGWLSANDIREKENQNPLPGDQGDQYLVPLNMVPADQLGTASAITRRVVEDLARHLKGEGGKNDGGTGADIGRPGPSEG